MRQDDEGYISPDTTIGVTGCNFRGGMSVRTTIGGDSAVGTTGVRIQGDLYPQSLLGVESDAL